MNDIAIRQIMRAGYHRLPWRNGRQRPALGSQPRPSCAMQRTSNTASRSKLRIGGIDHSVAVWLLRDIARAGFDMHSIDFNLHVFPPTHCNIEILPAALCYLAYCSRTNKENNSMWDFKISNALGLMLQTAPFIVLRLMVYFGITLAYILLTGIGAGVGYGIGALGDVGFQSMATFWGGLIG